MRRGSGLLLHITSLPSEFGIGDLGQEAYRFVDFLSQAGQTYWQLLPINPTDQVFGNSPYSSFSAFANNTLLISPHLMVKKGWLKEKQALPEAPFNPDQVDYQKVINYKLRIFDAAFEQFQRKDIKGGDFIKYCEENSYWLDDFALFVVLKEEFPDQIWNEWPNDYKYRQKEACSQILNKYEQRVAKIKFLQFVFAEQWQGLHNYCRKKNVQLIGDMPIYVNLDSVDVWTHPNLFKLDQDEKPVAVAGVPPDYFSATGQLWGNPVYNWNVLKDNNFDWWIKRLKNNLKSYDLLRIDHFRGLIAYWEVPAGHETAVNGHWEGVPYDDYFQTIKEGFRDLPIIAEDLGLITPDVTQAMKRYGFPGMKVLQFAFNGDMNTHPYLPHNYEENYLVYTGTHDNNTTVGWFRDNAIQTEKENLNNYLHENINEQNVHWKLIECAMNSKAQIALIPAQDLLGLGSESRMNIPGTAEGNWQWRLRPGSLKSDILKKLLNITQSSRRV